MEIQEDQWIYESPDGGKTVYRRPLGGDHTTRELSHQDQEYLRHLRIDVRLHGWHGIMEAAESDPALADLLERVECYYQLKYA